MLYLEPPFYLINGVSVFRDHVDPLQYYYMPMQPRLRTQPDAAGRPVPRLQLVKYRSLVAGNGGFLTFDVHVGLLDQERDDVASEIKRMARLPATPRLSPIQPLDGSVRLLLLGQDSGATPPPPKPGQAPPATGPSFVVKMQHSAKPSLYGDDGASFAVELDPQGTAIMETALKGEITPMVVVYELSYAALRPAFSVRLHIDWDRVQKSLDEQFGYSNLFMQTQIEKAVDKLIESRVIDMQADNFVPDADPAGKSVEQRFETARARVQEMITDAFFQPSLEPMKGRPDGWDKASQLFNDIGRAGLGGGLIGTFSYKKTDYTRIDKKRLDVEISERSAVVRTIYPQGSIDGLFRALGGGLDPKRFILEVDADDPFFAHRKLRVINRGEMTRDELASVTATLSYGGQVKSVLLEETGKDATLEWESILDNGAIRRPIEASYAVAFKPDAGGERPLAAKSDSFEVTGDVLELQPAELYARVTVPVIVSPSYPWDKYPQVQVRLAYEDPANGVRTTDTLILTKDDANKSWTFLALDRGKRDFRYRILHSAANHEDVDEGWTPTDADLVDIRDPFGTLRLSVDVVPVVPQWGDVEQLFVDLAYSDPANGVDETASLTFTPEDHAAKKFVIDRKDRARKLVSFKVTTVMKGGMVLEVPQSYTEAARILVRPDMRGHRVIAVTPPADFAKAKLDRVDVELRYQDPNVGIDIADRASFTAPGGRKTFEFDYVDPARSAFQWRAHYVLANGMTRDTDWVDADAETLVIKAP